MTAPEMRFHNKQQGTIRMTFKKTILAATAAAMTLMGSTAIAEALRVGVEGAYAPFSKKEADGTLSGFDIDIAYALCEQLERECVLVEQEWDGMIPALIANKYDAIVASMSITEDRKKRSASRRSITTPRRVSSPRTVLPSSSPLKAPRA